MRLKWMLITLSILLVLTIGVGFANDVMVVVEDQQLIDEELFHVRPGEIYGGLVAKAEKMGFQVTWNEIDQMAYLDVEGVIYGFSIGSSLVSVDETLVEIEYPAISVDGRMFVQMSYLAEILGFEYVYDFETNRGVIRGGIEFEPEELGELPPKRSYTEEDLLWLARIVDIEARDGSVVKKTAVANVVLNRVDDPRFPDTIYDVIFQKGQFPPAYYSSFDTLEPKEESFTAARNALAGEVVIEGALFFNYIPFKSKADSFIRNIEGDYFYY